MRSLKGLKIIDASAPEARRARMRIGEASHSRTGSMGLAGAVLTRPVNKAFQYAQQLGCGTVNEMGSYWGPRIPAGGTAASASGIGRTGGQHTLQEMSDLQTITITLD